MARKSVKVEGTNEEVLNAISAQSSDLYKSVVPETDGSTASYEAAYKAVTSNESVMNEFVASLSNLIGQVYIDAVRKWRNPLKELMRDYLMFGDTVEEVAVNIFQAHNYKPGVTGDNYGEVFKQEAPDVKAVLHKINHEKFYECSFNYTVLQKAFLNEGGLARFVENALSQLYNSAENDEYLEMRNLLTDNYKSGGMKKVKISDPTVSDSNAKALVKAIRSYGSKFRFISSNYNISGISTHTPMENLYLFITPEIQSVVDVDVLAMAFNMDKSDFVGKIIVVDEFSGTGISAILADRDAFMCMPKLFETHSIYDPRHLNINIYLHDHAMFSFSPFVNVVAFTTDDVTGGDTGDITSVKINSPASGVAVNSELQFTATVEGDSEADVIWSISQASSSKTKIDDTGMLFVGSDEELGSVIIVHAILKKNLVTLTQDSVSIRVGAA